MQISAGASRKLFGRMGRYGAAAMVATGLPLAMAGTAHAATAAGPDVVRGTNVPDGGFPWAVSIHLGSNPTTSNLTCTGEHIAPQFVLTAKHCLDENQNGVIESGEHQPNTLFFSLDRTKISNRTRGEVIQGSSVALNPNNDMAIVKLVRPSNAPLVMLGSSVPATGTQVITAGWGGSTVTSGNGAIPDNMQQGLFKVTGTSNTAGTDLLYQPVNSEEMCGGDSGGPVFTVSGGLTKLVAIHTNSPSGCGVNTGDARGSRIDAAMSWIRSNVPAQFAFVWAHSPTTASYTPTSSYSFSTNGTNTITRNGVGNYTVVMGGQGNGASDGNVQVTSYGSTSNRCKVGSWVPSGANLNVNVLCTTAAGAAADTTFVAQFYRAGSGDATQTAYVWAHSPMSSSYVPSRFYSYNSRGGTNTISRSGTGSYTVNLPGFTTVGGNVAVTAYGGGSDYCKVASWGVSSVNVRCFDTNGFAKDSLFSMRYTDKHAAGSYTGRGAYVWANDPSSSSYVPSSTYRFHSAGSTITAGRTGVGTYVVSIPNMPAFNATSAMATAYSSSNTNCNVVNWLGSGSGVNVTVQCHAPSGALADSLFTMSYETN